MSLSPEFETTAAQLPSLGGRTLGPFLRRIAAEAPAGTNIVEIGTWMGAGTAQLALGLLDRQDPKGVALHSYDRFACSPCEASVLEAKGITDLRAGEDSLPWVQSAFEPIMGEVELHLHKADMRKITWQPDRPISIYVDDASKTKFVAVFRQFAPAMIPGKTILILMDFFHFMKTKFEGEEREEQRAQQRFIEAHPACFEDISATLPRGTSSAAFLYRGGLDFARLATDG